MNVSIYMDECGDLGWSLDYPYRNGGSSRYLTLAAVIVPQGKEIQLSRVIRGFYKARKRTISNELKSVELRSHERRTFVRKMLELKTKHEDIIFTGITVKKENVNDAFRDHPNGLYNYMTKLLLLERMSYCGKVNFIPDARSVKIELKHSMHEYLRTELAVLGAKTHLVTTPQESKNNLEIQFSDILASIIWAHHEDNSEFFNDCREIISCHNLFFNPCGSVGSIY